jgi:hypothetical protein
MTHELTDFKNIILEIAEERERQDEKWSEQNHNTIEWLAILMEKVGEASKAALDNYFEGERYDYIEYRKEMIQVAAVAIAAIECFDRKVKE